MITAAQLRVIMPSVTEDVALAWRGPISDSTERFDIAVTLRREAAFLSNVALESGELRWVREIGDGGAYEYRTDLGNFQFGDGRKFKGRGLLQITGRRNYEACSLGLFGDTRLLDEPELLEDFKNAADSAGWYWKVRGLNAVADAGDFEQVCRKINGGLNGYDLRCKYLVRAKLALGMPQ